MRAMMKMIRDTASSVMRVIMNRRTRNLCMIQDYP
jgi:hypothetical protein